MKYTYFLLLLFSIVVPLAFSFESRVKFYRNFPALFSALFIVAAFFIGWDYLFTSWNVWSFNDAYLMGPRFGGMPLEEWMFFLIIPYCCVFIYESLNYYISKDYLSPYAIHITRALIILLLVIAIINIDRIYTAVTFLLTAGMLLYTYVSKKEYMGRFYLAYLVHLIPFFVVNGVLTAMPVVSYNDNENLGFRLGTIPVEDSIYSMLMVLMNIVIYEFVKSRMGAAEVFTVENSKMKYQDPKTKSQINSKI